MRKGFINELRALEGVEALTFVKFMRTWLVVNMAEEIKEKYLNT
jgi:hypothetical protein